MKIEQLKQRLSKDRSMTTITLRIPVDVVDDMKRIAPILGFTGYQGLLKAYVGQGLRRDLERLDNDTVAALLSSLKRRGVSEEVIASALNDAAHG